MSTVNVMLPYYGPVDLMQAAVCSVLAQQDPDWRSVRRYRTELLDAVRRSWL